MKEINLELGRPYVEDAMNRLDFELKHCGDKKVVKIIHGYGSSGKGGVIKEVCREALNERKDIKRIVYGEDFKIMNKDAYAMKVIEPELESLFHYCNKGITVVELK